MAYTPLAGKNGYVTVGGVAQVLSEWQIAPTAQPIDTTGFGSPTDGDGVVYETVLAGTVGAELTIKGRLDAGNNPFAAPNKIKAGMTVSVFCGYTSTFGFTVSAIVLSTPTGTNVKDAGNFEARCKVNGLITYPS